MQEFFSWGMAKMALFSALQLLNRILLSLCKTVFATYKRTKEMIIFISGFSILEISELCVCVINFHLAYFN